MVGNLWDNKPVTESILTLSFHFMCFSPGLNIVGKHSMETIMSNVLLDFRKLEALYSLFYTKQAISKKIFKETDVVWIFICLEVNSITLHQIF